MAAFAPIPSASVATTTAVNPELFAKERIVQRRSCTRSSKKLMHFCIGSRIQIAQVRPPPWASKWRVARLDEFGTGRSLRKIALALAKSWETELPPKCRTRSQIGFPTQYKRAPLVE